MAPVSEGFTTDISVSATFFNFLIKTLVNVVLFSLFLVIATTLLCNNMSR